MQLNTVRFDTINNILLNISGSLLKKSYTSEQGLLTGNCGIMVFAERYSTYSKNDYSFLLQDWFDNITINYQYIPDHYFVAGKCGINWFYNYINRKNLLTQEHLNILCNDSQKLQGLALEQIKNGNYDFLSGAIGIAYYFAYNFEKENIDFFSLFLDQLKKNLEQNDIFSFYDIGNNTMSLSVINLGLAHGLPSILKFCIECYKKKIHENDSKYVAYKIINYFLMHVNSNINSSYFPHIIDKDKDIKEFSRLAWCYGDLGIAFILYQSGIVFDDENIVDFGLEILIHTTKRRTFEETSVNDAGICHGSSGIAHIYNKMWHYTNNNVFKDACDYWIQRTIDYAIYEDGIGGYKKYDPQNGVFEKEYGLLEGTTGIGLVLLSYLTGDFSWDYCLMLND